MITGENLAFLTAFLNSSLFKHCFIDNFPELQGGTRELRKIFFDKIPILPVSEHIESVFQGLISEMQTNPSKELAIKMDNQIFELYGLSDEERQAIGFIEIR